MRLYAAWRQVALALCLAIALSLPLAGIALADEPPPGEGPGPPDPAPTPVPSVTNEYNTYNTFQFPVLGDVLRAVLGGVNEETRKAAQPGFDALNFTLKTPSLASDGQSIGGQLNFNRIVEPMWWAVLPIAGALGFVLLLLNGIQMQAGALSRESRRVGEGMQGLVTVVVGLAMAFFSLQLVHYANEGTNLLVDAIMGAGGPESGQGQSLAAMAINMIDRVGDVSVLASIIVAAILLIGALVLVVMAVARWALFFICVVLSPLALVAMGSRATGALTSLWGQLFMLVLLLGPANAIMLRSAQGLYAVAIEGSAFGLNSMAKGAVMFGLISMMGAINGMAIQRAFGVAWGWARAGVGVVASGALLAGGGAAAVMAGGGLGALTSSLRPGRGTSNLLEGRTSPSSGVETPASWGAGGAASGQGSSEFPGSPTSVAGAGVGHGAQPGDEETASWREGFQRRRQGFDWGRAALVGGALAGLAGGPLGRTGMAVQRLGMASLVEGRYREGREDRLEGRAQALAWREEGRQRGDLRDLAYQRQEIFGHLSGPDDVEVASAMDRAVHNVYQESGGDVEGLRKGLLALGREAAAQGSPSSGLYQEVRGMADGIGSTEEEGVEKLVGSRLEGELAARGTLRGPLRYGGPQGEPGDGGPESPGPTGAGPQGSGPATGGSGAAAPRPSTGWPTGPSGAAAPYSGNTGPGAAKGVQQAPGDALQENVNQGGEAMKGSVEVNMGEQPSTQGPGPTEKGAGGAPQHGSWPTAKPLESGTVAGQGTAAPYPAGKASGSQVLFDQATARIMGSRLGIYDGEDWAGPTEEDRRLVGEHMVEEARRLRQMGRLEEGLALSTEIGKEQPLEPAEAIGRLKAGVEALGPQAGGEASGVEPAEAGQAQAGPTFASPPGVSPAGSPPQDHPGPGPAEEPELFPPGEGDLEHGEQLSFEGWAVDDPHDLEEA